MQERSDHYIYCYFHPTGEPCYIGKGTGGRWKQHLKKSHNPHLRRIIAKAGGDTPHVKLHVGLTSDQATVYEITLIAAIGRGKHGPLVNFTNGGEGVNGYRHSEGRRAKISTALRGNTFRRWKPSSIETRERLSVSRKGKTKSAEHKLNIGIANLGYQKCLGKKWKLRTKRKAVTTSPERRIEINAKMIATKKARNQIS